MRLPPSTATLCLVGLDSELAGATLISGCQFGVGRLGPSYPLFLLSLLCSKFVLDTVGLYGTLDLERKRKAAQWLPIVRPICSRRSSIPDPDRLWRNNSASRNRRLCAATGPVIRRWPDRC